MSSKTFNAVVSNLKHGPTVERVPSLMGVAGNIYADADGVLTEGRVLIVNDLDDDRANRVLSHEVFGHYGPRVAMGRRQWRSFLSAVQDGCRAGDKTLLALRDHVRCIYVDQCGDSYLSATLEADELVARLAEVMTDPSSGGLLSLPVDGRNRMLAATMHFVRERLLVNRPVSAGELRGHLLNIEGRIRDGTPLWDRLGLVYSGAMPAAKPTGASPPPRDLEESRSMLEAANGPSLLRDWLWLIVGLGWCALVLFALWGLGYTAILILSAFGRFIH